jgi:hypothetical protein
MGKSRISSPLARLACATLLAAVGLASVSIVGAMAQTAEQRAACTPDAMRLCASAIPDVGRVTACMQAHRASLSARCQAAMPGAPSTTEIAAQRARGVVATPMQRRVVMVGHHRRVVVAPAHGPRPRRHMASGGAGGFNFAGGRGSRQDMIIALQVMSALSAACQNQSTSSQMCGVMNAMGSMGGTGGMGSMGGIGALAGFIK